MDFRDYAIIGLGYVGLPLARAAQRQGLRGWGFDRSSHVVNSLCGGTSHVDDVTDAQVQEMVGSGFTPTTDPTCLARARTILICVPTPLGAEGGPDLGPVLSACEAISEQVARDTLVILESTTWPGTTEELVLPILEKRGLRVGQDLFLAFSSERVDPGNATYSIENTPKVVGGVTPECARRASAFYSQFIEQVVVAAGTREAEMSKLLENTYRQVNIALVNEMAKFSHDLGIDIWDVIDCASTKPFGFAAFRPGPGVGGHCIPIDPNYLSHRVKAKLGYPFRFVELAQEVNHSMPEYVAHRAMLLLNDEGKSLRGAAILLLGVTYKPGIADQRESPAIPLARRLRELGACVSFYDPFVQRWAVEGVVYDRVADLDAALRNAELVIHLQGSESYNGERLSAAGVTVLDTRGELEGANIQRL